MFNINFEHQNVNLQIKTYNEYITCTSNKLPSTKPKRKRLNSIDFCHNRYKILKSL